MRVGRVLRCFAVVASYLVLLSTAMATEPGSTPTVVDKATLNWLMKHPTEPKYDRLRPMSGRWVRCQPTTTNTNEATPAGSRQDRFSSTDRLRFTRVIARASDNACKAITSEERTSFDCETMDRDTLRCRPIKKESSRGDGNWKLVTDNDGELAGSSIKISLKPIRAPKKSAKKATEMVPDTNRQLEIRITPDAADAPSESETILLTFAPRPKKASSSGQSNPAQPAAPAQVATPAPKTTKAGGL